MGVPAFFRWLTRKYPSVIVECIEQKPVNVNGVQIPVDSSQLNPNGVEFDNLYLDMNGIIHPCTHPEDKPAPKNEDEMMIAIFECIDRLFRIVRPRKVLYMAIDGVAPRAKMNQQRSRRFRASKETTEKVLELKRIKEEMLQKGYNLPPQKEKGEHFDSNCITPGTPFMDRLSRCLHYYIHERLQSDPGWRDIKVILSDANVPGEGEHKIMDFIRKQRSQPDHDPNTRHVLCGADADLIMLGLATHEPNFTIIREEFKPNKPRPCEICGQVGHEAKECVGVAATEAGQPDKTFSSEVEFIFVRLNILREYLERELEMTNLPFTYDFERAVDDWVFMCFFVGNDFLPHLPSLEIREGAIDRLVNLYKKCVYKTGGYITDAGDVDLSRVQMIMSELGEAEDEIFKKRQKDEIAFKARNKANAARRGRFNRQRPNMGFIQNTQFNPTPLGRGQGPSAIVNPRQEAYHMRVAGMHSNSNLINHNERMLKASNPRQGLDAMMVPENSDSQRGVKRKSDHLNEKVEEEDDQAHDEVRLWEDGFKDRYYESKFDVGPDNLEFRYNVALQYVRGLCWVLRYYYQGCASWKWYFPYHYAPFASDFINIDKLSTEFERDTKPFRPLEQLMGVFPAASSSHVPQPWAKLMSDPNSPIIDFYPEDFKIDLNGKKFAWQGVALLPFVDETRLFRALEPYYEHLTQAEIRRNIRGDDKLYVNIHSPGYNHIKALYDNDLDDNMVTPVIIQGMAGSVLVAEDCVGEGGQLNSPVVGLKIITDNTVYCARFRDPVYNPGFIFQAKKLRGAIDPPKVLKPGDHNERQPWKPQIGMAPARTSASLGQAGHRMVNHYNNNSGNRPAPYAAIPPPQNNSYQNNRGYNQQSNTSYNQRGGRGGFQSRGGGHNNRGGYRGGHQGSNRGRIQGGFDQQRQGGNDRGGNQGGGDRGRHQGGFDQQRQGGNDRGGNQSGFDQQRQGNNQNNYSVTSWNRGGRGGRGRGSGDDTSSNFRAGRGNYNNDNTGHVNKYSTAKRGRDKAFLDFL